MKKIYLKISLSLLSLFVSAFFASGQTTTYTTHAKDTIPSGVSTIDIKVYGGNGGYGGQDGSGNTNAAAGLPGYVDATFNVTQGDIIEIFPGGNAANGLNGVSASGGGAGGTNTNIFGYNGGNGGNAGPSGSSGAGGGGGAATVVTKNGTIIIVAGGASGGGGMANLANSGLPGSDSTSSYGTTQGGDGVAPGTGVDGGGGGGGGGGNLGSYGGNIYLTSGPEYAGIGGFRGNNSVAGATAITQNSFAASASGGQVIISSTGTLPVKLISFTGKVNQGKVILYWSTATEQNTLNFAVQHSINGSDWLELGTVSAAGNSSSIKNYSFTDEHPVENVNYYRLAQKDLDGRTIYSTTIRAEVKASGELFNIFPNPVVNGTVNIELKENAVLYIYSGAGKIVLEKSLLEGTQKIDVSRFAKGNYFIKIKDQTQGFIIQ